MNRKSQSIDVIVKQSTIDGLGVFAARDFKKDETVLTWHPKSITKDEFDSLSDQDAKYRYKEGDSYSIMQSPERYVNHSCNPNTKPHNNSDIAIRDIAKGEEITSNYRISSSNPNFICKCGSSKCIKNFINK